MHLLLEVGEPLPAPAMRRSGGAAHFRWEASDWEAELLVAPISPKLPPEMAVAGAWGALWRVRALRPLVARIRASWALGARWVNGGPDSGEHLAAQTWWDASTQVTIGAEDGHEEYGRASLDIELPACAPGEIFEVACFVAWGPVGRPAPDASTWFAVDQKPLRVLEAAGCR